MNTSDYISLLSGISTFITALISLFTLKTMERHKRESYKPNIIVMSSPVKGFTSESQGGVPTNWTGNFIGADKITDDENNEKFYKNAHFFIELKNIGLGAALDINFSWEFEIERFIEALNELAHKNLENFRIDKGESFGESFIEVKTPKTRRIFMYMNEFRGETKDYIHSDNTKSDKNLIILPHVFIFLISWLVHINSRIKDMEKYQKYVNIDNDLLKIYLNAEYTDIAKNRIAQKYCITFNLHIYNELYDDLDNAHIFDATLTAKNL